MPSLTPAISYLMIHVAPGSCDFHWRGNLFDRIYEYFHQSSRYFPGRLTPAAEDKTCQALWMYARQQSRLADTETEISKTWYIYGSENHVGMIEFEGASCRKDNDCRCCRLRDCDTC